MLQTFDTRQWQEAFPDALQQQAMHHLEQGHILYFPTLAFPLLSEERYFLSPNYADPGSKNISYHSEWHKLWGVQRLGDDERLRLKAMLERFFQTTSEFVKQVLPHYRDHLITGRTSFRPVQISGRKTSYRQDDKRLHVDAFPSSPNQGKRILRVFCNINPQDEDRVWRVGEPFEDVAHQFLPKIRKPWLGQAAVLRLLKITKSYRSLYDHYMLQLHDRMKESDRYQKEALQQELRFPSGATWIVQTDHVSHAAMQGQYVLEQTFYLPVKAMHNESLSPLRVLERLLRRRLV